MAYESPCKRRLKCMRCRVLVLEDGLGHLLHQWRVLLVCQVSVAHRNFQRFMS